MDYSSTSSSSRTADNHQRHHRHHHHNHHNRHHQHHHPSHSQGALPYTTNLGNEQSLSYVGPSKQSHERQGHENDGATSGHYLSLRQPHKPHPRPKHHLQVINQQYPLSHVQESSSCHTPSTSSLSISASSDSHQTHSSSFSSSSRHLHSPIPPEFIPNPNSKSPTPSFSSSARNTSHSHAPSASVSPLAMRPGMTNTYPALHTPRPELDLDCTRVSSHELKVSSHELRQRLEGVHISSNPSAHHPSTVTVGTKLTPSSTSHSQLSSTRSSQQLSSHPVPSQSQQLTTTLPSLPSHQHIPIVPPQQLPSGPAVPCSSTQLPSEAVGMGGAALGFTWQGGSVVQGYTHMAGTQLPPNTLPMMQLSQYASQSSFMNGHGLHLQQNFQSSSSPSQMQYSSVEYNTQQQQPYHHNFDQLQAFPQNSVSNSNYQFNVEYVDSSSAPQCTYQGYYYGNYQYSDNANYCNVGDNLLDPTQLSVAAAQVTTPFGDETVDDLGPEEVRWFYKVEADKKWTPFIGYDSLRIEWKYRDLLQDLRTEGNGEGPAIRQKKSASNLSPRDKQDGSPQDSGKIVVRGGLYEVDVEQQKCESIYWQGEIFLITRGTWFYDTWGPVEEQVADRIEVEHLTHFRGHILTAQRLDDATKEAVHSLSLPEGYVEWFSASEVYLTSDATPSRLMRSVGKKLGFQKTGCKLQRGYSIDATSSDKPPDINHIVFVIHGIGQKMERGRIIKNCTGLRENVNYLKQKYFPGMSRSSHTVEFFPVEWRSSLVLDAGVIESITPQKILNIRQMLNASFMDIMYYDSPLYRDEIITGLTNEMNRLYTMFTQRNPYFEANGGKVSMVAHSLGCVITYDIVTGWNPAYQFDKQLMQSLVSKLHKAQDSKHG